MTYNKTTWIDDVTPLSAENLNNIEDGIEKIYKATINGKRLSDNPSLSAEDIGALPDSTKIPIVDKKFSASSENAQSGKAVDEAIKQTNNIFSNALKGTKSGSAISVNDVSVVEHNLRVKVASKNLFNKDYAANTNNWKFLDNSYDAISVYVGKGNKVTVSYKNTLSTDLGFYTAVMTEFSAADNVTKWLYHNKNAYGMNNTPITLTATEDYIYIRTSNKALFFEYIGNDLQIEIGTTATEYTPYIADLSSVKVVKSGFNLWWGNTTDNTQFDGNGYINANGSISTHTTRVFRIPIKDTLKYNVTRNDGKNLAIIIRYEDKNKKFISADTSGYEKLYHLYTPPKNASYLLFSIGEASGNLYCFSIAESVNNIWKEPKMGQTVTANADGTVEGLTSLSPNMTLVSDTEGVVINLEYNIDTKMYIDNELAKIKAELSAAIVNS